MKKLAGKYNLPMMIAVLVLAMVPLVIQDSFSRHLIIVALIWAIVASNWDLSLGYGGIFNFAHLSFFGIGVYVTAIATKTFGLSPWLMIPVSGFAAVVAASIVFLPVLRLKGIYIILVTFAFSQLVVQLILSQVELTGGGKGLSLLPPLKIGDYNFARDGRLAYYYSALGLLIASTAFLRWLVNSNFGAAIVALRDHEDYAISRGVSAARLRLLTLIASALFTGIAGGFYATYLRVASVSVFDFGILSLVLSILLVGGACTIYGSIVASFALTLLTESMVDLGAWRFIIVAVLMIVVLLFYPGGLWAIIQHLPHTISRFFSGRSRKAAYLKHDYKDGGS